MTVGATCGLATSLGKENGLAPFTLALGAMRAVTMQSGCAFQVAIAILPPPPPSLPTSPPSPPHLPCSGQDGPDVGQPIVDQVAALHRLDQRPPAAEGLHYPGGGVHQPPRIDLPGRRGRERLSACDMPRSPCCHFVHTTPSQTEIHPTPFPPSPPPPYTLTKAHVRHPGWWQRRTWARCAGARGRDRAPPRPRRRGCPARRGPPRSAGAGVGRRPGRPSTRRS